MRRLHPAPRPALLIAASTMVLAFLAPAPPAAAEDPVADVHAYDELGGSDRPIATSYPGYAYDAITRCAPALPPGYPPTSGACVAIPVAGSIDITISPGLQITSFGADFTSFTDSVAIVGYSTGGRVAVTSLCAAKFESSTRCSIASAQPLVGITITGRFSMDTAVFEGTTGLAVDPPAGGSPLSLYLPFDWDASGEATLAGTFATVGQSCYLGDEEKVGIAGSVTTKESVHFAGGTLHVTATFDTSDSGLFDHLEILLHGDDGETYDLGHFNPHQTYGDCVSVSQQISVDLSGLPVTSGRFEFACYQDGSGGYTTLVTLEVPTLTGVTA